MCREACINGPVTVRDGVSRFATKLKIRRYAREDADGYPNMPESIPMGKKFVDRSVREDIPDEATIRAILAKIGKETPEQELRALRKRRFAILSELHQQQQDLDQIDYRIHQMRDGKKSGEE